MQLNLMRICFRMRNYGGFYGMMLLGITAIFSLFAYSELGFMTYEYIIAGVLYTFACLLSMLLVYESKKEASD